MASRPFIRHLCASQLEPLRSHFGPVHIASGYRTLATNTEVGGAPDSRHLYDRHHDSPAADVVIETATPQAVYDWLDARRVGGLGLYNDHVHVDLRRISARW
jgi:uncharacterized protein YcbK (DUF882 family)